MGCVACFEEQRSKEWASEGVGSWESGVGSRESGVGSERVTKKWTVFLDIFSGGAAELHRTSSNQLSNGLCCML